MLRNAHKLNLPNVSCKCRDRPVDKTMTTTRLFIIQTILVIAFVIFFHSTIVRLDGNVHDNYFIDRFNLASIIFVTYGLVFSVVYYIVRQRTNNKLGLAHFALGLPLFLLTFAEQLGFYNHDPLPRRYYTNYESKLLDIFPIFGSVIYQVTLVLFILGIATFIINLTIKKHQKADT